MLVFDQVTKKYPNGGFNLDNIAFTVTPGEFVFVTGHSGAGKTTLLRLLIRDFLPNHGEIFFGDTNITGLKRRQLPSWRRQVGVVFQNYCLLPLKTAYENLALVLRVGGKTEKEISLIIPSLLETVGLANRQNAFPQELSGGEQQRLAIARAISYNPPLLIADEPAGNLDKDSAWQVFGLFDLVNQWGTTVLVATHDEVLVKKTKKREIRLNNGRLVDS